MFAFAMNCIALLGVLGYGALGGLGGIPDQMPIAQNLEMEIQMEKWKKSSVGLGVRNWVFKYGC